MGVLVERLARFAKPSPRAPGVLSLEASVQDLRCKDAPAAVHRNLPSAAPAPKDPVPSRDPRMPPPCRRMPWLTFDMAAAAMATLRASGMPTRGPDITAEILHEAATRGRQNGHSAPTLLQPPDFTPRLDDADAAEHPTPAHALPGVLHCAMLVVAL